MKKAFKSFVKTRFQNARQTAFDAQAKRGGGGLGLGLSFAAPVLGGMASSFIEGGRSRSEMSTGERFASASASSVPTAAVTGAMIGSAILPGVGTAIGAVVGALAGFASATASAADTLEDLDAKLGKLEARAVGERDSLSTILTLTKQLQSGDLSEADRRKAVTTRGRLVQGLPADVQKQIGDDFDTKKIEDALGGSDLNVYKTQLENSVTRAFSDLTKATPEVIESATKDLARLASEDTDLKNVLDQLAKAEEQIEILNRYFPEDNPGKILND